MKKKININTQSDLFRIVMIIVGSLFSTLVLVFSIFALYRLQENNVVGASGYLLAIFIVLGLSRFVSFVKERTKVSFYRFIVLFVFDAALGVLIYFGKDNPYFYPLCGGLFCLTIVISRVFKIIANHSKRSVIYNSLVIIIAILLAVGLFIPYNGQDNSYSSVLIICLIVVISALLEAFSTAMNQLKMKVLIKIIFKTYALEVLLGLVTLIISSSLFFMMNEPELANFGDALWFSFSIVTTIGLGDYRIYSVLSRVVAVILGIYGIFVVAILTSIIVNFYNEVNGKHDIEQIKDVKETEIDSKKKKK